MKRLVNTNNRELDLTREYNSRSDGFKPRGLWYAIDNEWVEWCESEMPDWVREGIIELELNTDKLLVIETVEELEVFIARHRSKITNYSYGINWDSLKELYSGIEIRNYHELKWKNQLSSFEDIWLWGWDCSSGCIWDLSIIKSSKYFPLTKKETA